MARSATETRWETPGRLAILLALTVGSGLVGLALGIYEGATLSASLVAGSVALCIGPALGAMLVTVIPRVEDDERWKPGDLFLPGIVSTAAFCFVVPQAICSTFSLLS